MRADNDLVRSMVKCMVIDFGLFNETTGFNKDRLVKQFGGETVRPIVDKCVDNNTNGDTVEKWIQRVMNCFENDNYKLYRNNGDDYVPKTRSDVTASFRLCLTTLGISRKTFKNTDWNLRGDNDLVRSMVKCMVIDFGLFDETTGFNKDRLVKQFGGETVRVRVERCVDNNNKNGDTVERWIHKVMNCFEDDNLKLHKE